MTFAKRFETKKSFKNNAGGAYNAARRLGVLDKVTAHMKDGRKKLWTRIGLFREAKKYTNRTAFRSGSYGAYEAAKRLGCYEDVTAHMNRCVKWTEDNIKKEALRYDTKKKFFDMAQPAYNAAKRLGIFDDVTDHMSKERYNCKVANDEARSVDNVKSIYNSTKANSMWIIERKRIDDELQEDKFIYNAF